MYSRTDIEKAVNEITDRLKKHGIIIESVYLFGSYASEKAGKYSDIDIALISNNFKGTRFLDAELVKRYIYDFVDIEIHPFRPEDFSPENDWAKIIMETGIQLH